MENAEQKKCAARQFQVVIVIRYRTYNIIYYNDTGIIVTHYKNQDYRVVS
jgi:hypothetical protein